jgi:PAS domain-containing protein
MILSGAADCLERNSIVRLPVVFRGALEEKALHDQRNRAEKDLRAEVRMRTLAGNLSCGTSQCGLDGKFLDFNVAMVKMLDRGSRVELLERIMTPPLSTVLQP